MAETRPARAGPERSRLLLFAGGDLAFNLYWQSALLYLLFCYTEALHVPIAVASLCYAIAAFWNGAANFAIGLWTDAARRPANHRRTVLMGAIPLAASFVLADVPPPFTGRGALLWLLATQILSRTVYTVVNLAYLAMSARISVTGPGSRAGGGGADDRGDDRRDRDRAVHRSARPGLDRGRRCERLSRCGGRVRRTGDAHRVRSAGPVSRRSALLLDHPATHARLAANTNHREG